MEKLAGNRSDSDTSGGFTRTGPLEHVSNVLVSVLDDARKVCMTGPRTRDDRPIDTASVRRRGQVDGHRPLPVFPILVGNEECDWSSHRHAVSDAAQHSRPIGLDRHPPAATVSGLSATKLNRNGVEI